MGILPLMQNARMVYIGFDFGILFADPNEQVLRKKKVSRTSIYGGSLPKGYRRERLGDIEARSTVLGKTVELDSLDKKEMPILFKTRNKNPKEVLDKYIEGKLKFSDYERSGGKIPANAPIA